MNREGSADTYDRVDTEAEYVVLADGAGRSIGTCLKSQVHTTATPLHLAFSCWLLDDAGGVLLTRRALTKRTWPGVWTNACCGHPAPGESFEDAARRRVRGELGIEPVGLRLALPDFRYTATMANGVQENEICPVFVATIGDALRPDPDEVADWQWTDVAAVAARVEAGDVTLSPWLVLQFPQLIAGGWL
ncbi:MAG: isopentenyl-diphosphate Delta-isomerase [Kineosporiaceae bacterium]|nr:isopentenyl-diphosphate Delta-isomerase [Kineosporiaceae bacterium]MBK7624305.1 isopentenyl-diphosphate Delta-isomerase [Kineosporiaceae bacterium]